jgi:predicted small metal-binding protein
MMARVLYCNDLVPGCKFEARGDSDDEILAEFVDHISTVHGMSEISDGILQMVSKAIHEEVRVRSRAAGK